ncbi:hypothetical protein FB562_1890 [Homoserinimonas aerilata]|uniref:Uncharacterized protein n=1 Tax=Homoserinimonas aerilata TaxID=1162970 RepID=A0A542YLH5_9MICO|nr:hypothetical protein [Homoserinimonas aerilata]TQL48784.1 hypothetical protein FB562_1890 [Homoserinimonas aerilata]
MANQEVCPICEVSYDLAYNNNSRNIVAVRDLEAFNSRQTTADLRVLSCVACYQVIQAQLTERAATVDRSAAVSDYLDTLTV